MDAYFPRLPSAFYPYSVMCSILPLRSRVPRALHIKNIEGGWHGIHMLNVGKYCIYKITKRGKKKSSPEETPIR